MATITLDYNPHDVQAQQFLAQMLSSGAFSTNTETEDFRVLESYMTLEEFRRRAVLKVNKFYKDNVLIKPKTKTSYHLADLKGLGKGLWAKGTIDSFISNERESWD
ncbi:MAG: hypothetical protein FWC39_01330 [Bacteroidetes bacterium]|nr:hypothetical protein [Bacteroidota bacterium]